MVRPQVILPDADAECGKAFYRDRRTADWDRIALEFWNQATGHVRPDFRLAVYRCKRCGGFHISQKRVEIPGDSDKSQAHHVGGKEARPGSVVARPLRRHRNAEVRSAEATQRDATD